jgi:hypothetical protein
MFVTVLATPVNHEHRDSTVCVMRTNRRVSILCDRATRWRPVYFNAESAFSADHFGSDQVRDWTVTDDLDSDR